MVDLPPPRQPGSARRRLALATLALATLALATTARVAVAPSQPGRSAGGALVAVDAASGVAAVRHEVVTPPAALHAAERRARRLALRIRTLNCGAIGTGSGFAVDSRLVITNRHVVQDADDVAVSTWDGRTLGSRFATLADGSDLALVTVGDPLPTVATLAREDPRAGDRVIVAGYPQGGRQRTSTGRVVGYARDPALGPTARVLRLDNDVEPGNSGGPVLDADGAVVGVIYAFEAHSDDALAIPVSGLRQVLRDRSWSQARKAGCPR